MKTNLPKSVLEVKALILVKGILQVVQSMWINVDIQLQTQMTQYQDHPQHLSHDRGAVDNVMSL